MKKEDFDMLKRAAREADLVKYFQNSGYTVKRAGTECQVKEIAGLSINPKTNYWYYFYADQGGSNSIDCLVKVMGKSFNQAVYELTGQDVSDKYVSDYFKKYAPDYTSPTKSNSFVPKKKSLIMPEQAGTARRLFAYFCQTRKIPKNIVEELLHAKLLYQSTQHGNAVFVHRDAAGNAIGAEIQGTNSYKRYKGMAFGTGDSVFRFMPFPSEKDALPTRAFIFESAIDLMSFYTFCEDKSKLKNVLLLSMGGLKSTVPKQLEAQGVKIISCVDNDDAGRQFEAENHFQRTEFVKKYLDYSGFKDWNELLVFRSENPNMNALFDQKQAEKPNLLQQIAALGGR